jgi:hypothetical protein
MAPCFLPLKLARLSPLNFGMITENGKRYRDRNNPVACSSYCSSRLSQSGYIRSIYCNTEASPHFVHTVKSVILRVNIMNRFVFLIGISCGVKAVGA